MSTSSFSIPALKCGGCGKTRVIGGETPGAIYFITIWPATPNGNPDTTQGPIGDEYQCTSCGARTRVERQ